MDWHYKKNITIFHMVTLWNLAFEPQCCRELCNMEISKFGVTSFYHTETINRQTIFLWSRLVVEGVVDMTCHTRDDGGGHKLTSDLPLRQSMCRGHTLDVSKALKNQGTETTSIWNLRKREGSTLTQTCLCRLFNRDNTSSIFHRWTNGWMGWDGGCVDGRLWK